MLRVLMVLGAYAPEMSGGGVQCREIMRLLAGTAEFSVLTTTRLPTLPARDWVDGVPVRRVRVVPRRPWTKVTAVARLTAEFLRRRGFDILHLHGFSQKSVLLVLVARLFRKRLVLTLHSAERDDPVAVRAAGPVRSRAYAAIDRFIGVSPRLQQLYAKAGLPPEKFVLIPNGVDTRRFRPPAAGERAPLRRRLGLPDSLFLLLCVGYFSRDKQPRLLFEAWKRLRARGRLVGLVFIGVTQGVYYEVDPGLAAGMRQELSALGAEKEVVFVESTPEIELYYQAVDAYVLPSKREGLPLALLEAMAAGLPCVASRLEGITDTLIEQGVNGLLVAAGDARELSGALARLIDEPALRGTLGAAARRTILARYTIEETARRVLEVYRQLLARSSSGKCDGEGSSSL